MAAAIIFRRPVNWLGGRSPPFLNSGRYAMVRPGPPRGLILADLASRHAAAPGRFHIGYPGPPVPARAAQSRRSSDARPALAVM